MTGWRVAARLARREVRRRPWRSALVIALIAVPVAGVTLAIIVARTTTPTAAEQRAWDFGRADWVERGVVDPGGDQGVDPGDPQGFAAGLRDRYPEGSQVVVYIEGSDAVTDPDGHLHSVDTSDQPLDDPVLAGTMRLVDGRLPQHPDEVVLTQPVLDAADAAVGDRISLFLAGYVTVTGRIVDPDCLTCTLVVGRTAPSSPWRDLVAYVDLPPGTDRFQILEDGTYEAEVAPANARVERELRDNLATIYVVGGVVLTLVAIVAAAAFAVGARRQLRTLGLLSATGVPPVGLRRTVLLQGAVSGLVGGVVGVTVGLVSARLLRGVIESRAGHYIGSLDVQLVDLVGPLALGVAAASAAAFVPARTASRVPVLAALAGRKPLGRLPAWIPVSGVLLLGAGTMGLSFYTRHSPELGWGYGLAAALTVTFGGVALSPWLVTHTEPLARRLRGGARVAARDLARQRLRSGAVVAAVATTAGLTVFAASATATDRERQAARSQASSRYTLADNQAFLSGQLGSAEADQRLGQVRQVLPGAEELDVAVVPPLDGSGAFAAALVAAPAEEPAGGQLPATHPTTRQLVVVEPTELAETSMPDEVVRPVEEGKVVVFGALPEAFTVGLVGIDVPLERDDVTVVDDDIPVYRGDTIALISSETARRWGVPALYYGTLFQAEAPLSQSQRSRLRELPSDCGWGPEPSYCRDQWIRDNLRGRDPAADVWSVETSFRSDSPPVPLQAAAAGASLVFTLLVVVVALALTAAESEDERALLDAIGAPPRVRRAITAWQALLLPGLAMLLAVPGGLAVARATSQADPETGIRMVTPWLALALLGLGVPLASGGVAWLGATVGIRRRHRRDLSPVALAAD